MAILVLSIASAVDAPGPCSFYYVYIIMYITSNISVWNDLLVVRVAGGFRACLGVAGTCQMRIEEHKSSTKIGNNFAIYLFSHQRSCNLACQIEFTRPFGSCLIHKKRVSYNLMKAISSMATSFLNDETAVHVIAQ